MLAAPPFPEYASVCLGSVWTDLEHLSQAESTFLMQCPDMSGCTIATKWLLGEVVQMAGFCLQVESQLATAYCDSKAQQLDALLQEMLAEEEGGWARAPLPTGVRDCTMELLFALVRFIVCPGPQWQC